jgi:membrane protein YdbS with pleckstrin-like domain
MSQEETTIRKTPFLFLKWLVITEFFFALLPFLAATLTGLRQTYDASTSSGTVSYTFLVIIVMTSVQVLILAVVFVAWYLPVYHVNSERILYRRANLFEDKELIKIGNIADVVVQQGRVARRLDYGSLAITSGAALDTAVIRNIPNPARYASLIEDMIRSQQSRPSPLELRSVDELIAGSEGQSVEFKASLMWDYHRQVVNKALYEPVMKNIVGFMNATGGTLLIGVADDGEILGLAPDLAAMKKPDADGFENVFNMAFNKMIGVEFRRFVDLNFPEIEGRQICAISVQPSSEPAFLTFKGKEAFYVRTGNSSQPLSVSRANRYIRDRFSE